MSNQKNIKSTRTITKQQKNTEALNDRDYLLVGEDEMYSGETIGCSAKVVEIRPGVRHVLVRAFRDSHIEIVILPESVESIGYQAFRDSDVREVRVRKEGGGSYKASHDHISHIAESAFYGCKNLKIFEPSKVKHVGSFAFYKTPLTAESIQLAPNVHYGNCVFGSPN